jgi:KTSC domain
MPILNSDALAAVWYSETRQTLRATFRESGRTYVYEDVTPQEYAELMAAESKGAWFNAHIRDSHRFREV